MKETEVRKYKGFLMVREGRKGKVNGHAGEVHSLHAWKQYKIRAKRNCEIGLTRPWPHKGSWTSLGR